MISDDVFDVLMEIRKVDKEIAVQKQRLQQNHKKLLTLAENINSVKQLQLKAQSILINTQMKSKVIESELKDIHKSYSELFKYLNKHSDAAPNGDISNKARNIDLLRRDKLKEKVAQAKKEKEEVAKKLNDVEMRINIQKKKNSAMLLRLQKNLEELLQEETNLLNDLKSNI